MNNIEQAIEILKATWKKLVGDYRYQNAKKIDTEDAYYLAIQALQQAKEQKMLENAICCIGEEFNLNYEYVLSCVKEKQERDNPKPLTLEQLRERVGKPVWLVFKDEDYGAICGVVHTLRPEIHMCDEILMFENLHYVDVYDHEPKGE